MELLNISHKVYRYYIKKVKGNKEIAYDLARRKLTRNVLLAKKIPPRNEEDVKKCNTLYHYGNLHILVKDGWIIDLKNHRVTNEYTEWEFDPFKYVELTKELGIVE